MMVFTREDGDFHGQAVSFREGTGLETFFWELTLLFGGDFYLYKKSFLEVVMFKHFVFCGSWMLYLLLLL